jgi:hypothetical protein
MVIAMTEEKSLIDILLEKLESILPKHLKPYAFHLPLGIILTGIFVFIAWGFGLNMVVALLGVVAIMWVGAALWVFLKWLFTGK